MSSRKNKRAKSRKSAPDAPKRPRGRPGRAQLLAEAIDALGIDPDAIDPRRVLAAIAADKSQPATARVAAARALLVASNATGAGHGGGDARRAPDHASDALSARALEIMKQAPRRFN